MSKKALSAPFLIWIACGTVIPLLVLAYYGLTDRSGAFTFENFIAIFGAEHAKALGLSLLLAFISTVICFLLAYPLALILRESRFGKKGFMIFIFILPMWMNFLLRTYAWAAILGQNGLLSSFLGIFGIGYNSILYTPFAVLIGMVYDFLPFMVLPIYTSLSKMDDNLIDAAHDLGASNFTVFRKIIFPLSMPGVFSGITMVFMPSVTSFAISRILGGGKTMLIGDLIEQQFTVVGNWNFGSAVSMVLTVVILISMTIMSRMDDEDGQGGMIL